jgi:ribosomal protein L40E
MDDLRRPQWWTWVAAVLAVTFMLYITGSWLLTLLCFGAVAIFLILQSKKREKPASASKYCLKCGESLNANATECRACGSVSWSYKN